MNFNFNFTSTRDLVWCSSILPSGKGGGGSPSTHRMTGQLCPAAGHIPGEEILCNRHRSRLVSRYHDIGF